MSKNLKQKQEGFTIIEVMIVLVIAAVILLIVFLAVPALQRNSRNTQKKNEVAQVLAAASEFSSNNNGAQLTANDGGSIKDLTKVKGITTVTTEAPAANGGVNNSLTTVIIRWGSKCAQTNNANTGGTTSTNASARQIAAAYSIESASGTTPQCTEGGL